MTEPAIVMTESAACTSCATVRWFEALDRVSCEDGLSVAMLRPLAGLLGRLVGEAGAFLAALGIDDTTSAQTMVAGATVDQLLDAIATRRRDPTLGLTLAEASLAQPFGIFGHAVALSGTLRESCSRAIRFYGAITRRVALALETVDECQVALRQRATSATGYSVMLSEFASAMFTLHARRATNGAFALTAVRFSHACRADSSAAYERVFAAPVTFDAPITELVFDAELLDARLSTNDPITSEVLETKLASVMAVAGRSGFVSRIRCIAATDSGRSITLSGVASELATSTRTLRRQLADEGWSFTRLVDDIRRERADELLASGVSAKEIAFTLGFSHPSAFSRAYRRWAGRSLRALRATPDRGAGR
jgi:AraC-like DNA-binding protein